MPAAAAKNHRPKPVVFCLCGALRHPPVLRRRGAIRSGGVRVLLIRLFQRLLEIVLLRGLFAGDKALGGALPAALAAGEEEAGEGEHNGTDEFTNRSFMVSMMPISR